MSTLFGYFWGYPGDIISTGAVAKHSSAGQISGKEYKNFCFLGFETKVIALHFEHKDGREGGYFFYPISRFKESWEKII